MFCIHSHHLRRSSTASQPRQTDRQNSRSPPTTITYKEREPRTVPSAYPTSPHTNYAFLLPLHCRCFDSIYVFTVLTIYK
ncbi:hypothetical protein K503DRAFT_770555 [Rhizopogon vinicolor AM-OR11-026]|uniref:Uncharacterized protein n=1 Tax=Rhizopogon vinicolor AM-OR11-026 TaxID=1314800 RepID=A0A1B7N0K4_9AGAM|nr:hypothetical protein K503DRAFT_770555 [Rhizopogon vinicolor AM-OR11-026]